MATDIGMLNLQRLSTAPNRTKQILMNGVSNFLNYHYFGMHIFSLKGLLPDINNL
ncbi:hypothetical protein ACFP1I_00720 [Dyadobacter subterraneus]